MLTAIFAALVTWYLTKIYYTRTLSLKVNNFEAEGLVYEKCSKCAMISVAHKDNLRSPFYCQSCR